MLGDQQLEKFKAGEHLTAAFINKLAARAARASLVPGSFSNGAMSLQRQVGAIGGVDGEVVTGVLALILGTVPGSAEAELPDPLFTEGEDGNPVPKPVAESIGVLDAEFGQPDGPGTPITGITSGALILTVQQDDEGTWQPVPQIVGEPGAWSVIVANVINPSVTEFRGGSGIMISGSMLTLFNEDGEPYDVSYFVLPNVDHRSLPNYTKGTKQIVLHEKDQGTFQLNPGTKGMAFQDVIKFAIEDDFLKLRWRMQERIYLDIEENAPTSEDEAIVSGQQCPPPA